MYRYVIIFIRIKKKINFAVVQQRIKFVCIIRIITDKE
jgi:hypothetical protein